MLVRLIVRVHQMWLHLFKMQRLSPKRRKLGLYTQGGPDQKPLEMFWSCDQSVSSLKHCNHQCTQHDNSERFICVVGGSKHHRQSGHQAHGKQPYSRRPGKTHVSTSRTAQRTSELQRACQFYSSRVSRKGCSPVVSE